MMGASTHEEDNDDDDDDDGGGESVRKLAVKNVVKL